ncbi:MAG: PQQ-dependent sugar dehydrogenase [Polyangiales bacterium]
MTPPPALSLAAVALSALACSRRPAPTRAPVAHDRPAAARPAAPASPAAHAPLLASPTAGVGLGATLRLPAPFHTPSASNPARLVNRPPDAAPAGPPGTRVDQWASAKPGGRWLALAPNGDVFLSDHTAGTVSVLRDADGDGRAEGRFVFARGLSLPLGMAFHPDGWLYVACTDAVLRFRYAAGQTEAQGAPERVAALPGHGYNQHWTRNVLVSADGHTVFVTVGSATNVDVEDDPRRAAISAMSPDGTHFRPYATGLRNPLGMALHPDTGALYTTVNERDELGDDLVPDYLTAVREGAFYGWPFAYFGAHEDPRHAGERPDLVRAAVVPDLALGAHVAALGLIFPTRDGVAPMRGDALVALHGSWNRSARVGYKVVCARFANGRPTGVVEDFLTGFATPEGEPWGRPAGLLELGDGSILVVDDAAGVIWRVHR